MRGGQPQDAATPPQASQLGIRRVGGQHEDDQGQRDAMRARAPIWPSRARPRQSKAGQYLNSAAAATRSGRGATRFKSGLDRARTGGVLATKTFCRSGSRVAWSLRFWAGLRFSISSDSMKTNPKREGTRKRSTIFGTQKRAQNGSKLKSPFTGKVNCSAKQRGPGVP